MIFALIKVDWIHLPDRGNVVPDTLDKREEFQAIETIQTLWLMFAGERNL
jgi:hypothetical protein